MDATLPAAVPAPAVTHRRVLAIAVPMIFAHVTTPLLGIVSATAIGQLGEARLLAAVALGAVVFDFLFWAFVFLRMSTIGLTAQALGAHDDTERRAVIARALVMALLCGGALVLLQRPISFAAFQLMGASTAVNEVAEQYFAVRIWSAPAVFVNYAVLGWLIGQARTVTGLVLQVAINLVNMALTLLLVTVLGLGVTGAATANALAELSGAVVGLIVVLKLLGGRFGVARSVVFDKAKLIRTIAINRDIMIRTAALVTGFAFFTRQGAVGGDTVLAANAILMNLVGVVAFFLDGFATAAEQLGGQAVGARNQTAFRRAVALSAIWAVAFGTGASALFYLGGPLAIDVITSAEAVRTEARQYLVFAALTPFTGVMAFLFDGVFIGATWTTAMRNCMVAAFATFIAAWWLLSGYGNTGLWIAFLVFQACRGLYQWLAYPGMVRRTFAAVPR
ncbi:MATE family efflux transporter [Phreatobacter stygius]|uniref:MATE family efflux transporter n=1 Tax=Phreatobacter stygius TaxID=1940610 RepID=A0A4D7BDY9_9HYPH|nr:MATE family efflux transporter [Phreatobacter stygius]QCI66202.1 MATE family efflux transporter [Phreatobacter stygius]